MCFQWSREERQSIWSPRGAQFGEGTPNCERKIVMTQTIKRPHWESAIDWDNDGRCDFCGTRAEWPPTGEPAYAVCTDQERHSKAEERKAFENGSLGSSLQERNTGERT